MDFVSQSRNIDIKSQDNMNSVYMNLNNIETNLLTWGEPFDSSSQEDVIICITGNPGIPHFYIDFASELHKRLSMPICVIGHAGHLDTFEETSEKLNYQDSFNLKLQIEHKLYLLQKYVNPRRKIHLIGHSIGAWIIIELLQNNDHLMERVSSVNLLFPTIHRMVESKNGKFLNNILRKLYIPILFILKLLYLVPEFVLRLIIYFYLLVKCLPMKFNDHILKLINPFVIQNILLMAFEEMDTVKNLNNNGLAKIKHLTNVVYGSRDGWAPLEFMEDLKKFEPCLKMTPADKIEHAFVLKSSEPVADMVADCIITKINN